MVLVETVGVGQSETAVSNMVDIFVVVGIPGAGDELQGIKRGLLELADVIAVNKADGDQIERANRAAMEYRTGLHILAAGNPNWSPVVLTVSARDNAGLEELWTKIEERFAALKASGALARAARRAGGGLDARDLRPKIACRLQGRQGSRAAAGARWRRRCGPAR